MYLNSCFILQYVPFTRRKNLQNFVFDFLKLKSVSFVIYISISDKQVKRELLENVSNLYSLFLLLKIGALGRVS